MSYLCRTKYSFGIVLLAQPFVQFIYGFTVFQKENWPQNWRFCIFDLHFAQVLALFPALIAPTTHVLIRKHILGIVLLAQPFFQSIYGFTVLQMKHWSQS